MISLLKMIGGTWDQAKGYLRLDLDHLQSAINQRWSATFGDDNLLLPATIPGNTTTPLYVANTGPGQTLMFDLVDLGSGVKGILPFSHITPASVASLLLGRGSAAGGGNYQEITVGTGLVMTGQTLSNTGVPGPSGPAGPPGANGALVLLEQHSAATSATLDFTTAITAAYDEYMIEFVNIIPATDAKPFIMRVSTNGGVSYDAGANYYWNAWDFDESASASSGSQTDTSFQLLSTATTQANYSLNGSVKVFNPAGPAYTTFEGMVQSRASTADAHVVQWMTGGTYLNATAVNAIRFLFSAGNITSGTIRMYGVAKTFGSGGAVGPQGVPGLDGADGIDGLDGIPSPFISVTDDLTTNAVMFPTWVSGTPGNELLKTSTTGMNWNPSTKRFTVGTASVGSISILGQFLVTNTQLDDANQTLNIQATFPAVITALRSALNFNVTTAGSSSFIQQGLIFTMAAGYTGSAAVKAMVSQCNVATTGFAIGGTFRMVGAAGVNIGVNSFCDTSATQNIALFGGLGATDGSTFSSGISACLVLANGTTTKDFIQCYSNATKNFSVTDAGVVTAANSIISNSGNIQIAASRYLLFNTQVAIQGFAASQLNLFSSSGAAPGVGLAFATAAVLNIRTTAQTGDASVTLLNLTSSGTLIDKSYSITTPVTGGTVIMVTGAQRNIINPAGTLALLTVTLPASPVDGQIAGFSFTQVITGLTVNAPGGATVVAPPTTAAIDSNFRFLYQTSSTSWFPAA